jgi:hypothetical protein
LDGIRELLLDRRQRCVEPVQHALQILEFLLGTDQSVSISSNHPPHARRAKIAILGDRASIKLVRSPEPPSKIADKLPLASNLVFLPG